MGRGLLTRAALGTAVAAGVAIEARYRRHPGNALSFADEGWASSWGAGGTLHVGGRVVIHNEIRDREVMLRDVDVRVQLLSKASVAELNVVTSVRSLRKDYPARADGYWVAYVVKPAKYGEDSPIEFDVEITGPQTALDSLYGIWLEIRLATYGFEGARDQFHHVMQPLSFPDPQADLPWQDAAGGRAEVRAVKTHLLCPGEDPVEVVRRYALAHSRPGDIVTIGETPLAVMQNRFHDPRMLKRTWPATRLAQFMHGEGALGTAGGMRALMNEHGAWRVAGALVGGALGKVAGQAGWFYRLAGDQARLVDDVTGTLPPFDNFVVVGPADADGVCAAITAATGLQAAIVDANDLGKVDVVGASPNVDRELVRAALVANPAGNADETTPVVLIRPTGRSAG